MVLLFYFSNIVLSKGIVLVFTYKGISVSLYDNGRKPPSLKAATSMISEFLPFSF